MESDLRLKKIRGRFPDAASKTAPAIPACRSHTITGLSAKHASSGRSFREREEEVRSELKH